MGGTAPAGGGVGGAIYGTPVLLLTASGRVTGRRRTKPLLSLEDEAGWIVVGLAAAGWPATPSGT